MWMGLRFKPWRSPTHPWEVRSNSFYSRLSFPAHYSPNKILMPGRPSKWEIKAPLEEWLDSLEPRSFLFWKIPRVRYVQTSTKRAELYHGDMRFHLGDPMAPALRFSRKSDILMLKLMFGGRDDL